MADTYWQTASGFGVVDNPANVPAGASTITVGAYNALKAAAIAAQGTYADLAIPTNLMPALQPAVGAVAFTWDDGWDSHLAIAQMHARRNQKATFYITTNLLDTTQHLTTAQMLTIADMPHEIGCHSADHVNMTGLTPVTRDPQWAAQQTLEGLIGRPVRSYAYPFGDNNAITNGEGYGRFDRLATIGLSQGYYTGANGYGPWLYDPITYEGFVHGRFPWSQATHLQFMRLLKDFVVKRGGSISPYAHQVGNADTPTLIQITEALDFCAANGIPCVTAAEMFPAPKIVNPGFESGLDGWTVITAGAAGTAVVDTPVDAPYPGLNGTHSLRVVSPNTTTSGDSVHIFQTIPVRPLTAYQISAKMRYDATPVGVGKWSVRINEFNERGGSIASRSVRGSAAGAVWGQSSATPPADAVWPPATLHTHPDARFATVGLYLQELTGTFYADHVYFGPTEEGLLG